MEEEIFLISLEMCYIGIELSFLSMWGNRVYYDKGGVMFRI